MMLPPGAEEIAQTEQIRPLKRVEFDKLAAEGFFDEEQVELLFGMVVAMAPIDPEHNESVDMVFKQLYEHIGKRARVRTQSSFAASEDSEPLPDVFVVPNDDYWHKHPDHSYLIV